MIDFEESRRIAFSKLSKFEIIRNDIEIPEAYNSRFVDGWEIDRLIDINGVVHEITFIVYFPEDFPFCLPSIYISEKNLEEFKYIPHIEANGSICTYRSDTISIDYDRPDVVVYNCLERARRNVVEGKTNQNLLDYDDEFLAYWNIKKHDEKHVATYLNLIDEDVNEISLINIGIIKPALSGYNFCLYLDNEECSLIIKNLKDIGHEVSFWEDALCIPAFSDMLKAPPFSMRYIDTIDVLRSIDDRCVDYLEQYLNQYKEHPYIFLKKIIKGKNLFLGWLYEKSLSDDIPGFRAGFFKPFDLLKQFRRFCRVRRISTEELTSKRLLRRTSGTVDEDTLSFSIAGLGSVGSNLLYFLNSYNPDKFVLIDIDTLEIENTYRHLFGIKHVGAYKVNILKDYLLKKNPMQSVLASKESLLRITKSSPEIINSTDYFFLTIGNENIDKYVGAAITDNIITAPTFMIWVEPYLVGGHCLFFPNGTLLEYNQLLDNNGFFVNNIIHVESYLCEDNDLILSEGGCHTSYVPYSGNAVTLFLSALFPKINAIIRNNSNNAKGFTWLGDRTILEEKGINLSEFATTNIEIGTILEYDI